MYLAKFDSHLPSTVWLFLTQIWPNLAKFWPCFGYLDFLDLATLVTSCLVSQYKNSCANDCSFFFRVLGNKGLCCNREGLFYFYRATPHSPIQLWFWNCQRRRICPSTLHCPARRWPHLHKLEPKGGHRVFGAEHEHGSDRAQGKHPELRFGRVQTQRYLHMHRQKSSWSGNTLCWT